MEGPIVAQEQGYTFGRLIAATPMKGQAAEELGHISARGWWGGAGRSEVAEELGYARKTSEADQAVGGKRARIYLSKLDGQQRDFLIKIP